MNYSTLKLLHSKHDIAWGMTRHNVKGVTQAAKQARFAIDISTYRVTLLFPLVAGIKLVERLMLNRLKGINNGDLDKSSQLVNMVLYPIMKVENLLLRRFDLPIGSSGFLIATKQ